MLVQTRRHFELYDAQAWSLTWWVDSAFDPVRHQSFTTTRPAPLTLLQDFAAAALPTCFWLKTNFYQAG